MEKSLEAATAEVEAKEAQGQKPTFLQAIQMRRRRPSIPPVVEKATTPGTGKRLTAAGLTAGKAAPEAVKKTLKDFLKDSNEGVPMTSSTAASSNVTSGRATPQPTNSGVASRSVTTVMAPQVRVVGGEIVVDEESTLMRQVADEELQMDIVHDSGRHLTSHAFVKTSGNNRWKAEDTKKFYDVPQAHYDYILNFCRHLVCVELIFL